MPVVIAELVLVVGLFFAVVGYLAARGLLATWTHSIGYLLEALAGALVLAIPLGFGKHVKVDFSGPVRALDHFVVTALQNWCDGAEIEMGYCLHGLSRVGQLLAQAIDSLARETERTFDWLVHVRLPKWLKYALAATFPLAWLTKLIADQIRRALPHIRTEIHTVTHEVPKTVVQVIRKTVGGAVALPPWVIRLPHRLRREEAEIGKLTKRLHKVERFAAAAVFAGLLANALGVSTRCVRKGNVGKAARRLCGLDNLVMDALLADLAFTAGTISIVELAKATQKAAPLVATSMVYFVEDLPVAVADAEKYGKRALKVLDSLA